MVKNIFIVVISFFLFACQSKTNTIKLNINNTEFNLEIAQTTLQKTKGLSGRDSLCSNCGMIFVYDQPNIYPFWMKNTHFPLNIIWLNRNGQIVDLKTGQPGDTTILTPSAPAQYIIELPVSSPELSIGDTLWTPSTFPL